MRVDLWFTTTCITVENIYERVPNELRNRGYRDAYVTEPGKEFIYRINGQTNKIFRIMTLNNQKFFWKKPLNGK